MIKRILLALVVVVVGFPIFAPGFTGGAVKSTAHLSYERERSTEVFFRSLRNDFDYQPEIEPLWIDEMHLPLPSESLEVALRPAREAATELVVLIGELDRAGPSGQTLQSIIQVTRRLRTDAYLRYLERGRQITTPAGPGAYLETNRLGQAVAQLEEAIDSLTASVDRQVVTVEELRRPSVLQMAARIEDSARYRLMNSTSSYLENE